MFGECVVLFSLQLSVCLWWLDYRSDNFPTLKSAAPCGLRQIAPAAGAQANLAYPRGVRGGGAPPLQLKLKLA